MLLPSRFCILKNSWMVKSVHLQILYTIVGLFTSLPSHAAPWTPQDTDIVLDYAPRIQSQPKPIAQRLKSIDQALEQSQKIGQSNAIDIASRTFATLDQKNLTHQQKNHFFYLKGVFVQKSHDFTQALTWLDKVSPQSEYFASATLLKSRIFVLQDKLDLARQQCTTLFGVLSPELIHLCVLETQIDNPSTITAFQTLIKQFERVDKNRQTTSTQYLAADFKIQLWLNRFGATLAALHGHIEQARQFLDHNLSAQELYDVLLWTDFTIDLHQNDVQVLQETYDYLHAYASPAQSAAQPATKSTMTDAFLLRLARLAQLLKLSTDYKSKITDKIKLRLARQDTTHEADLAYYFLYIEKDKTQAQFWATQNWNSSKDYVDQKIKQAADSL